MQAMERLHELLGGEGWSVTTVGDRQQAMQRQQQARMHAKGKQGGGKKTAASLCHSDRADAKHVSPTADMPAATARSDSEPTSSRNGPVKASPPKPQDIQSLPVSVSRASRQASPAEPSPKWTTVHKATTKKSVRFEGQSPMHTAHPEAKQHLLCKSPPPWTRSNQPQHASVARVPAPTTMTVELSPVTTDEAGAAVASPRHATAARLRESPPAFFTASPQPLQLTKPAATSTRGWGSKQGKCVYKEEGGLSAVGRICVCTCMVVKAQNKPGAEEQACFR